MPKAVSAKKVGLSLAELNAKYNPNVIVPNKIRAALKQLGSNAVDEAEFRSLCGVAAAQLAHYRDQFEPHLISVRDNGRPKYLWAGTPQFAKTAREALTQ